MGRKRVASTASCIQIERRPANRSRCHWGRRRRPQSRDPGRSSREPARPSATRNRRPAPPPLESHYDMRAFDQAFGPWKTSYRKLFSEEQRLLCTNDYCSGTAVALKEVQQSQETQEDQQSDELDPIEIQKGPVLLADLKIAFRRAGWVVHSSPLGLPNRGSWRAKRTRQL